MAAVIKGTGVVWSMGAVTFTAGIVTATNASVPQSLTYERTSELTSFKSDGGVIRGDVYHGFIKTLRITVIPSGSSIANAKTSMDAHMPAPGTLITTTDDAGNTEGNWALVRATQNRTIDGVATIDLELRASDESIDLATSI